PFPVFCHRLQLHSFPTRRSSDLTGNNLVAMAWASHCITSAEIVRNWVLVYLGNAIGALGTVGLVLMAQVAQFGDGAIRETALAIDRKSTRLNSSHLGISYAVFCL